MRTLETKVMHVGNTNIYYAVVYDGKAYGLEIRAEGDFEGYILVGDVTRNEKAAMRIAGLFAENTVFPQNALEVFDDLFAAGEDFTNSY